MKNLIKSSAALAAAIILTAASVSAVSGSAEEAPAAVPAESAGAVGTIASVSKMYSAAAIMHLSDEGKIDIDAPVTEYLPEFRMADSRYKDITVRMLMNHTSGLMGTSGEDFMLLNDRDKHAHDSFLKALSTQRLKADPGEYAAYCNDGFTLLGIIVEAVSGESFTDYIENELCIPLGLTQTGTPFSDIFQSPDQAKTFLNGRIEMLPDYCMAVPSGGIISSASDLSRFGKIFFTGNTEFLSENAKNEMKKKAIDKPYEGDFGLGWDSVGNSDYAAAGVQILQKGGDVIMQHASLLVAPDQRISAAVITSGGSSSADALLASALIDAALEEKGIKIEHSKPEKKETLDEVPEKYLAYEDIYASSDGICLVSFPEGKYMQIKTLDGEKVSVQEYKYTTEDSFVLMDGSIASGKAEQAEDQTILRFVSRNGKDHIVSEQYYDSGSLGTSYYDGYSLQRVGENKADPAALKAWEERNGRRYYLVSEKYSSANYMGTPSVKVNTIKEAPGYTTNGTIADSTHLVPNVSMPGSRDMTNIEITGSNDTERLCFTDNGYEFISEKAIPELGENTASVALASKKASWYNIGKNLGGRVITLSIPENAAVYVYDCYDNMTYSSYMKDYGNKVYLPKNGKIVFLGEDGGKVTIS